MNTLVELRERNTLVLKEIEDLWKKDERSSDEEARIDALLAETNDLGPKIERAQQIDDAAKRAKDYTSPTNGNGHLPTVSREETTPPRNRPAPPPSTNFGRRYVGSEQYEQYKAHPVGNSERFSVGSFHHAVDDDGGDLEQRTLIYTGGTANLVPPTRQPGVYGPALMPFQVRMRDVLSTTNTDGNAIQYVRESSFTNAAAATAEAVSTSTGSKPESALGLTVVTSPVATIAHVVPVTRQTIDDVPQMQGYINGRLIDGLKLVEDAQILAGDGTGANLTGLNATSGIGDLNAAYWTANALPATGAAANKIDRIRRAKKYVAVTGLATATFIVLHPDDMELFDELKDTTGNYVVSDPVGFRTIPSLWGLTVVESVNQATNTFLVGDGRFAAIVDRMDATVFMSDSHSDWFTKNIFALMAEERVGLAVYRPSAFAKGVFS